MEATAEAARRFLVARHFLSPARSLAGGRKAVLEVLRRLGSIQFDPVAVAGRNHDLMLHARIDGYEPAWCDELYARRFLREHGEPLAYDLVAHKEADLRAKNVDDAELERTLRLRALLEQESAHPHRLADLAVDGADLLALGYSEGPKLGGVLSELLDEVVDDPSRNRKEWLLDRAKELA